MLQKYGMLLFYILLVFLEWYVVILYITGFSGVVCCYFIYYWFVWSGMLLFYILLVCLEWYVVILYITDFSGVVCCYFIYYWFFWSGMLLF